MRYVFLSVLILAASACTTIQKNDYCHLVTDAKLPVIYPYQYQEQFIRSQLVKITSQQGEFEFIGQLEVKGDRLILVAMTAIGQKLFQIQYQGQDIHFETFGIPVDFDPAYLLMDLGLMYAPDQAVRQCLAITTQFTIEQLTMANRVFIDAQHQPIRIEYVARNQAGAEKIRYTNASLKYQIDIHTIDIERLLH